MAEAVSGAVSVAHAPDGSIRYLVRVAPDGLPPVLKRDMEAAWDAVQGMRPGRDAARGFRFVQPDGSEVDLLLADRDARGWAAAVDRLAGLHTSYGVSLCLRLLALIDLLARRRDAARLLDRQARDLRPHPSLLRAAASAPLDGSFRFEETRFMRRLSGHLSPQAQPSAPTNGVLA